jgi:hypothetical protein
MDMPDTQLVGQTPESGDLGINGKVVDENSLFAVGQGDFPVVRGLKGFADLLQGYQGVLSLGMLDGIELKGAERGQESP